MTRVHGVHDDSDGKGTPSGCGWYRIIMVLDELGRHGWDVSYKAGPPRNPRESPLIIGQRIDKSEALPIWRRYRAHSRLVYEIDDDVWNVVPANWAAYRAYRWEHNKDAAETAASIADLVTVTTEPLAEILRKFNPEVRVVPNCIPGQLLSWHRPEPQTVKVRGREQRKVVAGWRGGASHTLDLQLIAAPVRHVIKRHPQSRLHIVGTDFRPTFGIDGADFTNWVPADASLTYYKSLLPFDVLLAPLSGLEFDRSKSAIAVMEAAALGIPALASDMEPYRDHVEDGVTGFLIKRRSDWAKRLDDMINDHSMREEMGAKARERAASWTIEEGWRAWDHVYRELIS